MKPTHVLVPLVAATIAVAGCGLLGNGGGVVSPGGATGLTGGLSGAANGNGTLQAPPIYPAFPQTYVNTGTVPGGATAVDVVLTTVAVQSSSFGGVMVEYDDPAGMIIGTSFRPVLTLQVNGHDIPIPCNPSYVSADN